MCGGENVANTSNDYLHCEVAGELGFPLHSSLIDIYAVPRRKYFILRKIIQENGRTGFLRSEILVKFPSSVSESEQDKEADCECAGGQKAGRYSFESLRPKEPRKFLSSPPLPPAGLDSMGTRTAN